MERLTEKRDGQNVIPLRQDGKVKWALCNAGKGDVPTRYLYGEHANKLADYENTGYPPEQVVEMAKELAEYKKLDEQGLLLKLPCKVGDTVYTLNTLKNKKIVLGQIEEIDAFFIALCMVENRFGKTVFLTKEEAEAKLKKMEGK